MTYMQRLTKDFAKKFTVSESYCYLVYYLMIMKFSKYNINASIVCVYRTSQITMGLNEDHKAIGTSSKVL